MNARILSILFTAAVACGPGSATPVIPTLPGDGDAHTAKPKDPKQDKGPVDPWAGRELIPPPAPIAAAPAALPAMSRSKLPGGLRMVAIPHRRAPVVSVQLAIRVGRADASRDKMGIEQLVARTLPAGTRKRSAEQLQKTLADAAASLHAQASYENTLISCQARSDQLATCLNVIAELVSAPTFPKGGVDAARAELAQGADARRQDPAQLAALHFQNLLWGDDHVRGWPMTPRTVNAITRKDLVAWHKRWFRPDNAFIAVAGDIDPAAAKQAVSKAFRTWRKSGKLSKRATYKAPTRERVSARLIDWPGQETAHIRIGHQGLAHGDKQFYRTAVFNQILGGAAGSRIVRGLDKELGGRSLGGTSGFDRNADPGIFVVSAAAQTKDALSAVRTVLQEMGAMAEKPPEAAEIAHAKTRLIGAYLTNLETASQIGNAVLAAELHQLGDDYVRNFPVNIGKVTADGARAAAEEILDPVSPVLVIVGDASQIAPQLQAVGVGFDVIRADAPIGGWERAPDPATDKKAAAEAKKILAKALEAKGGAAKLKSIKSMVLAGVAKGVIHDPKAGKQSFTAQVQRTYLAPDKMRRDIARKVQGQDAVSGIVLAGDSGWAFEQVGDQQGAGELPPALVEALKKQLWRDQELILLRHLDKGTTAVALPEQQVDGRPHHVVRVTRDDGIASTLFIDKKTYLLSAQSYAEQGSSALERYADYKDVGGIAVAHRRVTSEGATQFDMSVKKIQFNVNVPPQAFDKPKGGAAPK